MVPEPSSPATRRMETASTPSALASATAAVTMRCRLSGPPGPKGADGASGRSQTGGRRAGDGSATSAPPAVVDTYTLPLSAYGVRSDLVDEVGDGLDHPGGPVREPLHLGLLGQAGEHQDGLQTGLHPGALRPDPAVRGG